jgi:hypothetical protein
LSKELNFYAIVINLLSLHWFYCDLNMTANTKIVNILRLNGQYVKKNLQQ